MRRWMLILLPVVLVLASCSTKESQIKKAAVEAIRSDIRTALTNQVRERVHGKDILQSNFVDQVLERTEIEVENVDSSDSAAQVKVRIKTVPAKVLDGVLEIIAGLDPSKERAFNVSDGLDLVAKKMGISPDSTQSQHRMVFLKKDKNWKVEKSAAL